MNDKYIMWEGERWYYKILYYTYGCSNETYFSKSPLKLKSFIFGFFKYYYKAEFVVDFDIESPYYSKKELKERLTPYFNKIKRKKEIENNELI